MAVVPGGALSLKSDYRVPAGLYPIGIHGYSTYGFGFGNPDPGFGAVLRRPLPTRPIYNTPSGPSGWRAFGSFGQTDIVSQLTGGLITTQTFLILAGGGLVAYLLLRKKSNEPD